MATNYRPETKTRSELGRKCRAYCPKFVAAWAFRYLLNGEHRRETHRERESGMSDTAAGCEQTCKRTEHSPALLAIGFDAVTYTEKWRRCCGIVHRLFLPSSAFYGAPILFIDLTRPPNYALFRVPRFLPTNI